MIKRGKDMASEQHNKTTKPCKTNRNKTTQQSRTAGQNLGRMTDQNNSESNEILTQPESRLYQQPVKISEQNSNNFPVKQIGQNSKTGLQKTEQDLHKLAKLPTKLA